MNRSLALVIPLTMLASATIAHAADFKIEDAASPAAMQPEQMKSNVVIFSDQRRDELADSTTGLLRFEDWAKSQPLQKEYLSLYPSYVEPKITGIVNGVNTSYIDKLSMYLAEARFLLPKQGSAIDLSRYVSVPFLEKIDTAIKHRAITGADAIPAKNPEYAFNQNPNRAWCGSAAKSICIQSNYQLEGKLPTAIQLVNTLMEGKKHADYFEFQSELTVVPQENINQDNLKKLTRIDAPVVGVLEQNVFYVNQVMEFGKFLAVLQQHPTDKSKTIVTAYLALAVKNKVLDRKKEFAKVPVLRNLVPEQVLMGNSSFNTGNSLSAGLPRYSRNQILAVANILARD